jgi:hypothetical protein
MVSNCLINVYGRGALYGHGVLYVYGLYLYRDDRDHGDVRADNWVHTRGFLQNKLGVHRRDIRGSVCASVLRGRAARVNKWALYVRNVYPPLPHEVARKPQQVGVRCLFQLGHKPRVILDLTK